MEIEAQNQWGLPALHPAVLTEFRNDAAPIFCEFGADIEAKSKNGMTPLHFATYAYFNVDDLCTLGADTDAKDEDGMTPLHHAVIRGRMDSVGLLCAHGANVEAIDRYGSTPLELAIYKWPPEEAVSRVLLEHGAVEPEDGYGLKRLFRLHLDWIGICNSLSFENCRHIRIPSAHDEIGWSNH